jgi:hypothetical protein
VVESLKGAGVHPLASIIDSPSLAFFAKVANPFNQQHARGNYRGNKKQHKHADCDGNGDFKDHFSPFRVPERHPALSKYCT